MIKEIPFFILLYKKKVLKRNKIKYVFQHKEFKKQRNDRLFQN